MTRASPHNHELRMTDQEMSQDVEDDNPTSPSEGAMRAAEWIAHLVVHGSPSISLMAAAIDRHIAADAGARLAALEEAAVICETKTPFYKGTWPSHLVESSTGDPVGHLFATAIRALQAERGGR